MTDSPKKCYDVILSSGFLAFGRHCGFLKAIEDSGIPTGAVCGTSSGALIGGLWLSGHSPSQILEEVSRRVPVSYLRPSACFWRGCFSINPFIRHLKTLLPPTFADLPQPFAVGVGTSSGEYQLISSGKLPEAIAASCAIPYLFSQVMLDGNWFFDGGAIDRTGVQAWRSWRKETPGILHLVARTHGPTADGPSLQIPVARTPASGASLWSLKGIEERMHASYALCMRDLKPLTAHSP